MKTKISTPLWKEPSNFYKKLFGLREVEAWDEPSDKGIILALGEAPHSALLELYASNEEYKFDGLSLQFEVADIADFLGTLPKEICYYGPSTRH